MTGLPSTDNQTKWLVYPAQTIRPNDWSTQHRQSDQMTGLPSTDNQTKWLVYPAQTIRPNDWSTPAQTIRPNDWSTQHRQSDQMTGLPSTDNQTKWLVYPAQTIRPNDWSTPAQTIRPQLFPTPNITDHMIVAMVTRGLVCWHCCLQECRQEEKPPSSSQREMLLKRMCLHSWFQQNTLQGFSLDLPEPGFGWCLNLNNFQKFSKNVYHPSCVPHSLNQTPMCNWAS